MGELVELEKRNRQASITCRLPLTKFWLRIHQLTQIVLGRDYWVAASGENCFR